MEAIENLNEFPKVVRITAEQYLVLRALLRAASQDKERFAITRVFYDHTQDQFVATNGHLLRVEKLQWLEERPENSFFLSKRDLMLTKSQLVLKYGTDQHTSELDLILVDLEYGPHEGAPEYPYPNYMAVVPKAEARRPLEWIALNPRLIAEINSTFHEAPTGLLFQFTGPLTGILLYDAKGAEEEAEARRFIGLVMPIRPMGETPEPLFELKEIERRAPGGEDEAPAEAPEAEQEDLVAQAARGPVED